MQKTFITLILKKKEGTYLKEPSVMSTYIK